MYISTRTGIRKVKKEENSTRPWLQEDYNLVGDIKHIYTWNCSLYNLYIRS